MKAVLLGLVLLPALALALLSIRPGGLRRQLRYARRRLKIALVLGGVYLAASAVAHLLVTPGARLEYVDGGIALLLAITFVVLAQDPAAERR